MKQWEKEANQAIEKAIFDFFVAIGSLFKTAFYGCRKLKKWPYIVGLVLCIAIAALSWLMRDRIFLIDVPFLIKWAILIFLLAMPIICLAFYGAHEQRERKRFFEVFKMMDFKGRDKKNPVMTHRIKEGKKDIYYFKSAIPLHLWEKEAPTIESMLNWRILNISEAKSKNRVKLETISAEYVFPEKIEWQEEYSPEENYIVVVGETISGDKIYIDFDETAHVLIAGMPGTGKSVIECLITWQMIKKGSLVFMGDFKGGVEFGEEYEKYGKVILTRERAVEILKVLSLECTQRYELFRKAHVKKISQYNKGRDRQLSRIMIIFDEVAEMLDGSAFTKEQKGQLEEINAYFSTIARLGRACGVSLIFCAQRPSADILTGQIKNMMELRICGRFADNAPSEIVLGSTRATELPKVRGRMIFQIDDPVIIQAYLFEDSMLGEIKDFDYQVLVPELLKIAFEDRKGTYQIPEKETTTQINTDASAPALEDPELETLKLTDKQESESEEFQMNFNLKI